MAIAPENLKALSEFARWAAEYCDFIDSLGRSKPDRLYQQLEALLARLHAAIQPVQMELGPEDKSQLEPLRMAHDQWLTIANLIGDTMGTEIKELFEHHGGLKEDAGEAERQDAYRAEMLWDDLAGVYRDLQHGLALWRRGDPDAQAEAAWQWRWGYENHWGRHLLRATMTVHEIRYLLFQP